MKLYTFLKKQNLIETKGQNLQQKGVVTLH